MRNTRETPDIVGIDDESPELEVVSVETGEVAAEPTAEGVADDSVEADAEPAEKGAADGELPDAAGRETPQDQDVAAEDGDVTEVSGAEVSSEVDQADESAAGGSPVAAPRPMIDPRGPRFGAAITVVVLAVALVTIPSVLAVVLLVWQAIAFGAASFFGIQAQPYGILYRASLAPRLGPPQELEDAAPPRFAQQVGLVFVLVALVGLAFSLPVVAYVATAFALAAAFLNAAFNFCLGCEIYLLVRRFRRA